jgi:histidine triad (HIT) family protein
MTESGTIFDKIISKEIPADIVYEDSDVLAFRDISPQAPVHVLVIPKKPVRDVGKLSDEAMMGKLFVAAAAVAAQEGLEENGYRLVVNTGMHGGQTVNHLHIHVLGGRQLNWPPG